MRSNLAWGISSNVRRSLVVAVMALVVVLACGVARADTFYFSFSNDPTGPGDVSGTVTGEVFGLPHNGTGAATDIEILSYPAGLVLSGTYTPPVDVFSWTGAIIAQNSYTVVNGVITGGGFSIYGGNGDLDQLYLSAECVGCTTFGLGTGTNFFDIGSDDRKFVWNDDGIGATGVAYTPVTASPSAVPEPGTIALFGSGLVGFAGMVRRRLTA